MDETQHRLLAGASASPTVDWEVAIKRCAARRNASTLDLARIVAAARVALPRGEWTRVWAAHRLPFSKRKAEMLAVIGRELGTLNAQTFARLPSGWSILYHLAHLTRPLLMSLIADATIHPALTLAQARALLLRFKGKTRSSGKLSSITLRLRRFACFVRATSSSWTDAERQLIPTELHRLAKELESSSAHAGPLASGHSALEMPYTTPLTTTSPARHL